MTTPNRAPLAPTGGRPAGIGTLVLAYLGWFATCALAGWTLIELRGAVLAGYLALKLPRNSYALADQWSFAFFVVVCLALVIFAQWHIGRAPSPRALVRRLLAVNLPVAAVLGLAYAVQRLAAV